MVPAGFENKSERYCSTFNLLAQAFEITEYYTALALAPAGVLQ